jgi:hypothetical protein
LEDEPQNQGESPLEDPINGMPEEDDALENQSDLINVIQQNAVIVTGWRVRGEQPGPDKPESEVWL